CSPLLLYSFPTRRSSDLGSHTFFTPPLIHSMCGLCCRTTNKRSISITSLLRIMIITVPHKYNRFLFSRSTCCFYNIIYICCNRRSEEHTSELQSRFDLVC